MLQRIDQPVKSILPNSLFNYFFHLNERLEDERHQHFEKNWNKLGQYQIQDAKRLVNILHKTAKHLTAYLKQPKYKARATECIHHVQQNMAAWDRQATKQIEAGAFNPQNLSNSLWAYGALGMEPSVEFMTAWEGQAIKQVEASKFNSQGLSNSLWAYATLGMAPSVEFMTAWERQATKQIEAGGFNSQELSNSLWAYATLGMAPSVEFMTAWEPQAINKIEAGEFNSQNLSNSLWACGVIDSFSAHDLLPFYQRARQKVSGIMLKGEQKQVRDADLWFTGQSSIKNVIQKETSSKTEIQLKEAFEEVGYNTKSQAPLISVLPKAIDFPVSDEKQDFWNEVDGPTHYIRHWKTGEVRLNGATLFRSALLQKFAPEAVIVRMGLQVADNIKQDKEKLRNVFTHFSQQEPGVYLVPEPNQVGGSAQNVTVLHAKRRLERHVA